MRTLGSARIMAKIKFLNSSLYISGMYELMVACCCCSISISACWSAGVSPRWRSTKPGNRESCISCSAVAPRRGVSVKVRLAHGEMTPTTYKDELGRSRELERNAAERPDIDRRAVANLRSRNQHLCANVPHEVEHPRQVYSIVA